MRVKGVSPVEHEREVKLPVDEKIAHAISGVEKYVPAAGPMLH